MLELAWTPLALPLIVGAGVTVVLVLFWRVDRLPQEPAGTLLLAAGGWWSLAYAFELLSVGLDAKVFFAKIAYVGIILIPIALLDYALRYSGHEDWLTGGTQAALFGGGLVTIVLVATQGAHALLWRNVTLDGTTTPPTLHQVAGPGFWTVTAWNGGLVCVAGWLMVRTFLRVPLLHGRQLRLLAVSVLILWTATLINVFGIGPGAYLDLKPYALLVDSLLLAVGVYRVRTGDILPATRAAALDTLPDGVLMFDAGKRLIYFNEAASGLLAPHGTLKKGTPIDDCCPALATLVGPAVGTPGFQLEETLIASSDKRRWYDVRVSPLRDGRSQTVSHTVVLRDVTPRIIAQRELQARHRYLEAIWEAVPEAIVVVAPEGVVQQWNRGAERLFGYASAEAEGQSLEAVTGLSKAEAASAIARLVVLTDEASLAPTQVQGMHKDGVPLSLVVAGASLANAEGLSRLVLVFTDVTEFERVATTLRELNEALETRVEARTAELLASNAQLAEEIEHHRSAEASLAQRNRELLSLQAAAAATTSSLDLAFVLETLTWEMIDLLNVAGCSVYEWQPDRNVLVLLSDYEAVMSGDVPSPREIDLSLCPAYLRTLVEKYAQVVSPDEDRLPPCPEPLSPGSRLLVPMVFQDKVAGLVELSTDDPGRTFEDRQISLGQLLANQAAIALEHARLYRRAQHEISERQKAESVIRESLREKDMLLQEIHHRVKNNLQVISSLLNLQSRTVQDEKTLEVLRESQNRLRSMALIHERLYRSDNLAQVDFAEYLRGLTSYLIRSYRSPAAAVGLTLQVEDVPLSIERAVPCGLIVNELVSNALKYAFVDGRRGQITIGLHQVNGHLRLLVEDNGVGLPEGIDVATLDSLGLQLVHMLAEQLGGSVRLGGGTGTTFEVNFPV